MNRYDPYLAHYGVKGMKWGVRHERERVKSRRSSGQKKSNKAVKRLAVAAAVGTVAYAAWKVKGEKIVADALLDSLGLQDIRSKDFGALKLSIKRIHGDWEDDSVKVLFGLSDKTSDFVDKLLDSWMWKEM